MNCGVVCWAGVPLSVIEGLTKCQLEEEVQWTHLLPTLGYPSVRVLPGHHQPGSEVNRIKHLSFMAILPLDLAIFGLLIRTPYTEGELGRREPLGELLPRFVNQDARATTRKNDHDIYKPAYNSH